MTISPTCGFDFLFVSLNISVILRAGNICGSLSFCWTSIVLFKKLTFLLSVRIYLLTTFELNVNFTNFGGGLDVVWLSAHVKCLEYKVLGLIVQSGVNCAASKRLADVYMFDNNKCADSPMVNFDDSKKERQIIPSTCNQKSCESFFGKLRSGRVNKMCRSLPLPSKPILLLYDYKNSL